MIADQLAEKKREDLIDCVQLIINCHRSGGDSQKTINSMVTTLFRDPQHQSWVNHQIFPCDDRG
jgi:hypothetical protein|tara:strand:- start:570 stop:761 length:192 start_codon:yes stop_codon:yes gene_type:complete